MNGRLWADGTETDEMLLAYTSGDDHLLDAHAKAYQAIKAGPGDFPVGVTLTTQAVEAVGEASLAGEFETLLAVYQGDRVDALSLVAEGANPTLNRVDFHANANDAFSIALDGRGGGDRDPVRRRLRGDEAPRPGGPAPGP